MCLHHFIVFCLALHAFTLFSAKFIRLKTQLMEGNLKDIFKEKLTTLYGDLHHIVSKFGTSYFVKISSD